MALELPEFPWDALAPFGDRARAHPDGMIDLSVGSPVDETPRFIRDALAAATDAHSYPLTAGSVPLREAIVAWYARRRGVELGVANVMPSIGSKELVALMPLLLGLGRGDIVVQPTLAYPTYAIGAALVGATVVSSEEPADWPSETKLIWLNSPSNPDGRVLTIEQLRVAVARARELGAVIVNDECYAELSWDSNADNSGPTEFATPCILDPAVIQGSRDHVLSVYSLSKQSNLAGYRAGFVAGCSDLIDQLLSVRKHIGLIPPAPVQAAMVAALGNDEHVQEQRAVYEARRDLLMAGLITAEFDIDDSDAGLYLWATRGEDSWKTVDWFASIGILVVPGSFYGETPATHVRIALTASDEQIEKALERIVATAGWTVSSEPSSGRDHSHSGGQETAAVYVHPPTE